MAADAAAHTGTWPTSGHRCATATAAPATAATAAAAPPAVPATEQHSLFFLGARTLESFRDFGILPGFAGVVVSDRYVNYFHPGWEYVAGHQACLSHLLRDYRTPPRATPARSGRCRRSRRCAD